MGSGRDKSIDGSLRLGSVTKSTIRRTTARIAAKRISSLKGNERLIQEEDGWVSRAPLLKLLSDRCDDDA